MSQKTLSELRKSQTDNSIKDDSLFYTYAKGENKAISTYEMSQYLFNGRTYDASSITIVNDQYNGDLSNYLVKLNDKVVSIENKLNWLNDTLKGI